MLGLFGLRLKCVVMCAGIVGSLLGAQDCMTRPPGADWNFTFNEQQGKGGGLWLGQLDEEGAILYKSPS